MLTNLQNIMYKNNRFNQIYLTVRFTVLFIHIFNYFDSGPNMISATRTTTRPREYSKKYVKI